MNKQKGWRRRKRSRWAQETLVLMVLFVWISCVNVARVNRLSPAPRSRELETSIVTALLPKNFQANLTVQNVLVSDSVLMAEKLRFAYAYVIGGVKVEDPLRYRNYIYDVMISTYNMRRDGSTADIIVMVQMSSQSSVDALPEEDDRLLKAMGIQVKYIEKAVDESFYRIMLDKFRILSLTEYDRIIYMDSDVMATKSLDYLFTLSIEGVLKRNVILAGSSEPANGGLFLLSPSQGAMERVLQLIREKEERGAQLPYPHWDNTTGWGHPFEKGEAYDLIYGDKGSNWAFYGAFADQGLLYHWVKYEEKSVSIILRRAVQNWGVDRDGKLVLEETLSLSTLRIPSRSKDCFREYTLLRLKPCTPPHSDFVHFTANKKPWLTGVPANFGRFVGAKTQSADYYWFHILHILNKKFQMGLDFNNYPKAPRPLLGMYPRHSDVVGTRYTNATFEFTIPEKGQKSVQ